MFYSPYGLAQDITPKTSSSCVNNHKASRWLLSLPGAYPWLRPWLLTLENLVLGGIYNFKNSINKNITRWFNNYTYVKYWTKPDAR